MTRVKMVKTLTPDEIPNGAEGDLIGDATERGLHIVEFDNGKVAYVFLHEVEVLGQN